MGNLPNRSWAANQPSTVPGTVTGNDPRCGMPRISSGMTPLWRNAAIWVFRSASDRPSGARPEPLYPYSCSVLGSQIMKKMSPPIPFPVGSIKPRAALAAIAPSRADPPCLRMSMAICEARGCAVAAMPLRPYTALRLQLTASGRPPPPSDATAPALSSFAFIE